LQLSASVKHVRWKTAILGSQQPVAYYEPTNEPRLPLYK
jgi:hypothetical protein